MKTRLLVLVPLFIAAACGGQAATEGTGGPGQFRTTVLPLALEPPPVYSLLGYRDRLGLTSEQVTALDSIAIAVREANAPLITELEQRAILNARAPGVLQVNPSERPLLDEVRENNRAAIEGVAELLTEEQQSSVCDLYQRDRSSGQFRRAPPPQGQSEDAFRRGTTVREDTSLIVRAFTAWPWCIPAAPEETTAASPF
jgi:hypothetical protein